MKNKSAQQLTVNAAQATHTIRTSSGFHNVALGASSNAAHISRDQLKYFSDDAIMEEYLRRFSPLAKTMKENE